MDGNDILSMVNRWVHLLSAFAAVGGIVMVRFALLPALKEALPDDAAQKLREAVMRRWSKVVNTAIGLLLITGFYNFFTISIPKVRAGKAMTSPPPFVESYHSIFGVKFLLALTLFFITAVLVGRSARFAGMRANAGFWMGVNVLLAMLILFISVMLGRIGVEAR